MKKKNTHKNHHTYTPSSSVPDFFAIRLSQERGIQELNTFYKARDYSSNFTINGLTHDRSKVDTEALVFMVASGWKSNMSFSYTQGLYGVAKVVTAPQDDPAKKDAYVIDVKFIFFFDHILTRKDFLTYPDTTDIPYIGPSTKGTKTQAISTISTKEAQKVLNASQKLTQSSIVTFGNYFPWFFNTPFVISKKKFNKMTDAHSPELNVEIIAKVFAEFIKNYSQEDSSTMIGIFGRWGRGKTFFYNEVKTALHEDNKQSEKFYFCEFQPWKYQEKENAWAYLYQTVLNTYLNKNVFNCGILGSLKYPKLFILNLRKLGWGRIISFLLLIGVTFLFIGKIPEVFSRANNFVPPLMQQLGLGISGIIAYILYKVLNDHGATAINLVNKYTKNTYFANKLGFQHEIQEELKTLLKTFVTADKKLVIFIDDLDRCNEKMIVDIIDSLKLMLDDDEIRKRVIVLTALDERILLKSIKHKYYNKGGVEDEEQVISPNEYIEKFFLVGIKLDKLDRSDIDKLVDQYIGTINRINTDNTLTSEKSTQVSTDKETSSTDSKEERTDYTYLEDEEQNMGQNIEPQEEDDVYLMNKEEQEYLRQHMHKIKNATPRKINMFIHRYLFFRALASEILNKSIFISIDPKLYIDLIFLISQEEEKYKELEDRVYQANIGLITINLYEYEYELEISEAVKLLKIAEMVSPF